MPGFLHFENITKRFGDIVALDRVTLLNDMRESIGAALKFLGYS